MPTKCGSNVRPMSQSELFLFPGAVRRNPDVDAWFAQPNHELRRMAEPSFWRDPQLRT